LVRLDLWQVEFIKNEDYKYVRMLGAFYMRLVGSPLDVYQYLEVSLSAECVLKDTECSPKDPEGSLKDTDGALKHTECSLKDTECSLKDTEYSLLAPAPKIASSRFPCFVTRQMRRLHVWPMLPCTSKNNARVVV